MRYARHETQPVVTPEPYMVAVWHGEGRTVFYVVDSRQPESEQPAVVCSFNTAHDGQGAAASWLARDFCERHNLNARRAAQEGGR